MGKEVENAFRSLTQILLGRELGGLEHYGPWLEENHRKIPHHQSALSAKALASPPLVLYQPILGRAIAQEEIEAFGPQGIGLEKARALRLDNAIGLLEPIRYYAPDRAYGHNEAMEECSYYGDCSFCFRCSSVLGSRYCAYSFWPRNSEYMFGVDTVFSSKFALKCYNSTNLTRCFEVSHSSNCSDSYYCHNSDNLQNALFCFNAKSLRYAVCNVEVGKAEYERAKKMLLDWAVPTLEREKRLSLSIYNVGCANRK